LTHYQGQGKEGCNDEEVIDQVVTKMRNILKDQSQYRPMLRALKKNDRAQKVLDLLQTVSGANQ